MISSRLHAMVGLLALAVCATRPSVALEFSDIAQEGQLRFLAVHPSPGSYSYESQVSITEESMRSGVVQLATCHRQLDPIRKIVIAFNPQRLQGLEVSSAQGIGNIDVREHRVEMTDVQKGAAICIRLSSRALDRLEDGTLRLQAGPLMRRYFDGYLPMQASLAFQWPADKLRLARVEPAPQPGVVLTETDSGARLDVTFAGRLSARVDLVPVGNPAGSPPGSPSR